MKKLKLGAMIVIAMGIVYFFISYGLFFSDKESIDLELHNAEITDTYQDQENFETSTTIISEISTQDLFKENLLIVDDLADQYINDDIDEVLSNIEDFLDIDPYNDNNIPSLPLPPQQIDQPTLIEDAHLSL